MTIIASNILDVTLLEPKRKHPAIFEQFDALHPGEALTIRNDHDPKPLYYQLLAERGNVFEWTYLENGPEIWFVEIRRRGTVAEGETIGEITAADFRKAEVFKKFGIDFCCGGKKTIDQVCKEKGINAALLRTELEAGPESSDVASLQYQDLTTEDLIKHIVEKHHAYVTKQLPLITELAFKVERAHAEFHPELIQIRHLMHLLSEELSAHLQKEERVLFPYINRLVICKAEGRKPEIPGFDTVERPINMMEMEHESAGELLEEIKSLSAQYNLPADACNSYRLLFELLQAFEADLHVHIHLENNILFPRAITLEKSLALSFLK